jgi:hypothetical protein
VVEETHFDPTREYRIECEACEGEGAIERGDMLLHHLHSESPEYGRTNCGECDGDGWRWTDKPCTLNACPPGLFVTMDGYLGFKSEYVTTLENPRRYQRDAYVVESGEYFWGGAKTSEERGQVLVRPIASDDLREAPPPTPKAQG